MCHRGSSGYEGQGASPGSFRGRTWPPARQPGWVWPSVCLSHCLRMSPSAPSSPAPPCQQGLGNSALIGRRIPGDEASVVQTGCRMLPPPWPLPHTAMKDLLTSQKQACWQEHIRQGDRRRVAWNPQLWPQAPEGGSLAQEAAPEGRLPVSLRSEVIAGHQLPPDSKEVLRWTAGDQGAPGSAVLGVGVQGPAPKVDRGWQAQRATRGLQIRPSLWAQG